MGEMFDSAGGDFPAGATQILLPSDGRYAANNAAVKAKFPDAAYQTYSADGTVPANWIDVETGCVWPPAAAVSLWHSWKANGITRGFYCAKSTRPQLEALLQPGDNPEWFEADPTNNPHILAGDAETQWGWFGNFDETETPDQPAPAVRPAPPAPTVKTHGGNMLAYDPVTGGTWAVRPDGSVYADDGAKYLGGLNTHPEYQAGGSAKFGPAVGIAAYGPGGQSGYEILTDNGTTPAPCRYRFPRDGSLAK